MSTLQVLNTRAAGYAFGIAVGALAVYLIGRKLLGSLGEQGAAIAEVVDRNLNPTRDTNILYRGSSNILRTITRGRALSVGDALYQVLHPSEWFAAPSSSARDAAKRNNPYAGGQSPLDAAARRASPVRPEDKAAGTWWR